MYKASINVLVYQYVHKAIVKKKWLLPPFGPLMLIPPAIETIRTCKARRSFMEVKRNQIL